MQIKLLHDLVEEMAGTDSGRIVEILFNKKDVNEFLIAKKMDLTINQVRNILYKLSADGLVSFIRKKDKRKGWYIYYWTLETEKCLVKLEQSLIKKIDDFKALLHSRETKRFYKCGSCGIEVGEEKALEHGFTCEECAEVYNLSDNSSNIRDIKAKITRTEKELKTIQDEIEIIHEKNRKKQKKADKKEEKAKKASRTSKTKKIKKPVKKAKNKKTKKGFVKNLKNKLKSKIKKKINVKKTKKVKKKK